MSAPEPPVGAVVEEPGRADVWEHWTAGAWLCSCGFCPMLSWDDVLAEIDGAPFTVTLPTGGAR